METMELLWKLFWILAILSKNCQVKDIFNLEKLSFGTTDRLNLPLNLSIFYRICLQNGKSLKTLYVYAKLQRIRYEIAEDDCR